MLVLVNAPHYLALSAAQQRRHVPQIVHRRKRNQVGGRIRLLEEEVLDAHRFECGGMAGEEIAESGEEYTLETRALLAREDLLAA
jgi:hypothetical protein